MGSYVAAAIRFRDLENRWRIHEQTKNGGERWRRRQTHRTAQGHAFPLHGDSVNERVHTAMVSTAIFSTHYILSTQASTHSPFSFPPSSLSRLSITRQQGLNSMDLLQHNRRLGLHKRSPPLHHAQPTHPPQQPRPSPCRARHLGAERRNHTALPQMERGARAAVSGRLHHGSVAITPAVLPAVRARGA